MIAYGLLGIATITLGAAGIYGQLFGFWQSPATPADNLALFVGGLALLRTAKDQP